MTNVIPNILKENNNRLLFCSILILSGLPLLAAVAGLLSMTNYRVMLRQKKSVFILLLIVILSYCYGYVSFRTHSLSSLFNIIISVILFVGNRNFSDRRLELRFINIYIIANVIFICYEIFNITNYDNRFESFFIEPSYLAIVSGYLLIRLGLNNDKKVQIAILILFIFASQSITGILFITYYLISNRQKISRSIIVSMGVLLLIWLSFFQLDFIFYRLGNITSDISTTIRVIAPLLVIKGVIMSEGLLGSGYGYLDEFLVNKYKYTSEMDFFLKKDFYGKVVFNTNVDNVYYYLFASMGILGFVACIYFTIYSVRTNGLKYTLMTLMLGFSMGFLTLPIFISRFLPRSK